MKSFIYIGIIMALFVGLFLASRYNGTTKKTSSEKVVLTTFTVIADMAQNVAGDAIKVESLTRPGTEIHGYEPTPQDLVRAQNAVLILDNGMNLEKWADKLYSSIPNVPHVTLTEGIEPIFIAEGPYKANPNPHAWMSPSNAVIYVENIKDALIQTDPQNTATYEQNARAYIAQIKTLDIALRNESQNLESNKRFIVSCEGAFSYLARDYGFKELYLWPINADAQGTPQQVKHVVEQVRKNKIPSIFCESTVNNKAQMQVANETGAAFGGAFYVDSLSGQDGPTPTYLKMAQYNIDILVKGLNK